MADATIPAATRVSYERSKRRRGSLVGQRGSDLWLLATVLALVTVGLLLVYSATYTISYFNFDGLTTWYLQRQAIWAVVGGAAMGIFWLVDYRFWQRLSLPLMALVIAVLLATLFVGKVGTFGATRWLVEGGSVQPSEAAKLVTILYVAHWASSKGERIRSVEVGLIPFGILIGTVCALILLQPSFSTALLVGTVATTMFFIAGADLKQLVLTGGAAGVVVYFVGIRAAYRLDRIIAWRDPWALESDGGYQTAQSLYALGKGGMVGQGLGTMREDVISLPAGHTDSILAVLGQELGLIACLFVLGLFLLLAHRGFRIAATAPDAFGTVLASGITCWLLYQALLNVAVVTNSIPNTGIPIPFISFGGSGLVTAMAGAGLLLSISRAQPPAEPERAPL